MVVRSVLVVGAGYAGTRRAHAAAAHAGSQLTGICDIDPARAATVTQQARCAPHLDWRQALDELRPDVTIVSTPNRDAVKIAGEALAMGCHVLMEKPFGRSAAEARGLVAAADAAERTLKVGFNLRFAPALVAAHRIVTSGEIGPLRFVRCVYGHGGRTGYDAEWRADPEIAGGGELLDQGVHIVDLLLHWLGRPARVHAELATLSWDMRVEDNAFATMRWADGQLAQFHASWTQWINRFTWQAYGEEGAVEVNGLGGSYGEPELIVWRRREGVPDKSVLPIPAEDSWAAEWNEFLTALDAGQRPAGDSHEAVEVMEVLDELIASASRSG